MKKENQINEPVRMVQMYQPWGAVSGGLKYSEVYLNMIVQKILSALRNVAYYVDGSADKFGYAKMVADWLTANISVVVWQLWSVGYIVLQPVKDEKGRIVGYKLITSAVPTDPNGKVIGYDLVYYSETYRYMRKSDFQVLNPTFSFLNSAKNADAYLTTNLGAFGILCGKSMPVNNGDKDRFLQRIKDRIGITKDKFQIEVFSNEVDFKQVDFHIKDLALSDKIKDEVKLLAAYFNVPYDLIPLSGQSTYANQENAIKQLYGQCISPLAEEGLDIGRYLIKMSPALVPSDRLTFRIDNVPELEDDRTAEVEYKTKVAELCKTVKDAGLDIDISGYQKQIENIER